MKHILKSTTAAAAVVLAGGVAGTAAGDAKAEDMTIVSWGGAYTMSQTKAYHEPWMEKTGDEIVNVDKSANGLAGLRAQVQAGNVTWDLVDMLEAPAMRACDEGLVEEIDYDSLLKPAPDGTPATEDFIEGSLSGCFIPQIVYATLFAYNSHHPAFEDEKPETSADVFDTVASPDERFPSWSDREWFVRLSLGCAFEACEEPLVVRHLEGDDHRCGRHLPRHVRPLRSAGAATRLAGGDHLPVPHRPHRGAHDLPGRPADGRGLLGRRGVARRRGCRRPAARGCRPDRAMTPRRWRLRYCLAT